LTIDDTFCLVDYGLLEDRDNYFFNCVYYVFLLIDGWLAISRALYENFTRSFYSIWGRLVDFSWIFAWLL